MPLPDTKLINPTDKDTIDSIIAQIKSEPKPLILVLGEYDASLDPVVKSLCCRAIVPGAVSSGATIIDDGANSGCSALIGQASQDEEHGPTLIGIAPRSPEAPEPNHTVIVRLPPEWPDPVKVLFQIVAELAKDQTTGDRPVLAVLFGGSQKETGALVRCARRGWPVLLMQGSGGIADQILSALEPAPDGKPPATVADPGLREVIETADIYRFSISGNVDDLNRILLARIDLRVDTLIDAWTRYDGLDETAIRKQALFTKLQLVILSLGVIATVLAISQSGSALPDWLKQLLPASLAAYGPAFQRLTHVLMVLTPITISVLVAISSRFREGNKWILLRASAEGIKREIFRYRMRAGAYSDEQCLQTSRESKLAAKLREISSALSQSEVNRTSLLAVVKNDPARLTFLRPDDYLKARIDDQISYFVTKTDCFYRRLKATQIWIYVIGGTGTLLAAFRGDVWVALTTAIATALTTRLEMNQVENTLVQYNQALTGLRNIASWWKALSQWEKGRRKNVDLLVEQTEKTLEGELAGWVQQVQTALDKLTEKEQSATEKDNVAPAKS